MYNQMTYEIGIFHISCFDTQPFKIKEYLHGSSRLESISFWSARVLKSCEMQGVRQYLLRLGNGKKNYSCGIPSQFLKAKKVFLTNSFDILLDGLCYICCKEEICLFLLFIIFFIKYVLYMAFCILDAQNDRQKTQYTLQFLLLQYQESIFPKHIHFHIAISLMQLTR